MISRRHFTTATAAAAAMALAPRSLHAATAILSGDGWRRYQVTTRLDLTETAGAAQAWIPLSSFDQPDWIRAEGNRWTSSSNAQVEARRSAGADLLHVQWGEGARFVEVTSTMATRDRAADFTRSNPAVVLSEADRALYLRGTALAPTDGIVRQTADRITAGKSTEIDKAQAIYQWIVENTYRSAKVPGCGDGDVVRLLRGGDLGGKCADLNPLFVALARASGLPARDLYGIRVAPSRLGYKSLGPATPAVTKAQHCRAEVFLHGLGWTAMDPADVRKVMLEETPEGLRLDDPKVASARARLFGSWEGNWVPFNAANDVVLPGRSATAVNFLMYPQIETAAGMLDCYSPDQVRYVITSTELAI